MVSMRLVWHGVQCHVGEIVICNGAAAYVELCACMDRGTLALLLSFLSWGERVAAGITRWTLETGGPINFVELRGVVRLELPVCWTWESETSLVVLTH